MHAPEFTAAELAAAADEALRDAVRDALSVLAAGCEQPSDVAYKIAAVGCHTGTPVASWLAGQLRGQFPRIVAAVADGVAVAHVPPAAYATVHLPRVVARFAQSSAAAHPGPERKGPVNRDH